MGNAYSDSKVCKCLEDEVVKSTIVGTEGRSSTASTSRATSFKYMPQAQDLSVSKLRSGKVRSYSQSIEIEADVNIVRVQLGSRGDTDGCIRLRGGKASESTKRRQRVLSESSFSGALKTVPKPSLFSGLGHEGQAFKALLTDLGRLSLKNEVESNEITESKKASGDVDLDSIPKHVLYYGWFFTPETSSDINEVVMYFYKECYNQIDQFQRFILGACKDADIRDPFEYYKKPGKRIKADDEIKYHITAKFMDREPDLEYQTLVQPFLGKSFCIQLVGIVFTTKTLGIRVKLTPAQKLMFDERDEYRTGKKLSLSTENTLLMRSQIQEELDSYSQSKRKTNQHCKLKSHDRSLNNKVVFKPLKISSSSTPPVTTSRAHITIGCAPKVKPKRTGDDLVDIIDLEQRPADGNTNFQQDFKTKHGILRQFGRHGNAFVLHPDLKMIVSGEFRTFI